jgi:hypothetical protein
MELRIKKSFFKAFKYFKICLKEQNVYFAIENLPLPKYLLKNRHKTSSFLKTPILYITAFFSFLFHWIKSSKDINKIYNWLNKNKNEINKIATKIPGYTKNDWKHKTINIYPVIAKWGGENSGSIYIGTRPFSFLNNPELSLIIHELIHANNPKNDLKELQKRLEHFDLAQELATITLTRKIQKDLNISKNNLQELSIPLKEILDNKSFNKIQKNIENKSSFEKMIIESDYYLKTAQKI